MVSVFPHNKGLASIDSRVLQILLIVAASSSIVNQYLSQAAILLAIVVGIVLHARAGRNFQHAQHKWFVPRDWLIAFSFVVLAAVPMALSSDSMRPVDAPLRYSLLLLLMAVLPAFVLRTDVLLRSLSASTVIAVVLVSVFNLYPDSRHQTADEIRIDFGLGVLDSAFAAVFYIPFIVAQMYRDRAQWLWAVFGAVALLAALYISIMTGTRGTWLALVVAPLISIVLIPQRSLKLALSTSLTLAVLLIASYFVSDMVRERVDAAVWNLEAYEANDEVDEESSLGLCLDLWEAALVTFGRYPIDGASFQQRAAIKQELIDSGDISHYVDVDGKRSAHNEILNAMSMKGLLGLLAILLLYWVPGRFFRQQAFSAANQRDVSLPAASAVAVAMVVLCGFSEALLMSGRFSIVYSFTLVVMYALTVQQVAQSKEHQ
ncbi:MAG: O-antigen ligase family protein [Pseudomonadales bacterium]